MICPKDYMLHAATFWHVDPFFSSSWTVESCTYCGAQINPFCRYMYGTTDWTNRMGWARERAAGSDPGSPGILVPILRDHVEISTTGSPDRRAFPGCWPDHVSPWFTRLAGSKAEIQTAGDSSNEEAIRVNLFFGANRPRRACTSCTTLQISSMNAVKGSGDILELKKSSSLPSNSCDPKNFQHHFSEKMASNIIQPWFTICYHYFQ